MYNQVEQTIVAQAEELEKADWANVNPFSQTDLIGHLTKYPNTVHKQEIDDAIWSLINKENVQELQNYRVLLPQGSHIQEAQTLLNSIVDWSNVKNTNDIFVVNDYIKRNPNTPFIQQAQILMMGLKQNEKQLMRTRPNEYDVSRLMRLLDEKIVTEQELILDKVVTQNVLDTLRYTDVNADLPDIRKAIESSHAELGKFEKYRKIGKFLVKNNAPTPSRGTAVNKHSWWLRCWCNSSTYSRNICYNP